MPKRVPFIHKFLKRLDRLDRESVQSYLRDLAQKNTTYEEILNHLGEGIILLTKDQRVRSINRQAILWLEIKSPSLDRNRSHIPKSLARPTWVNACLSSALGLLRTL